MIAKQLLIFDFCKHNDKIKLANLYIFRQFTISLTLNLFYQLPILFQMALVCYNITVYAINLELVELLLVECCTLLFFQ